jgi:hypothetical protein
MEFKAGKHEYINDIENTMAPLKLVELDKMARST